MENDNLTSWIDIKLKELGLNFFKGVNVKEKGSEGEYYFIPSGSNFPSGIKLDKAKKISKEEFLAIDKSKILQEGDILFNSGGVGTLGRSSYFSRLDKEAVADSFVIIIRDDSKELNSKYIYYWFQTAKAKELIEENTQGTTGITSIKSSNIQEFEIPFAPLPEQHRIVAKLDELMEKTERSKKRLEKIPLILKRFRQSVLAAAVSEKLTEEWRKKNKVEDWNTVLFEDLILQGPQNGMYKPQSAYGSGTMILRIDNFYEGEINPWETLKKLSIEKQELKLYSLSNDDIIINRVNSMPYLGKSAIVKNLIEPCVFESNMMRVKLKTDIVSPDFMIMYLNSMNGLVELRKNAKHAVNQASINQQDVKAVEVPLPSIKEQHEIVRRVEALFALAEKIETRYTKAKAQFDKLPQALLAKAFKGELVEQDAEDESAEKLLERIRNGKVEKVKQRNKYGIKEEIE